MLLIRVFDRPNTTHLRIIVGHTLLCRTVYRLLVGESVAVEVTVASDLSFILNGINLDDLALQTIKHRVDSEGEDVLMMLSGNARSDNHFVCGIFGLILGEEIGVDDTGRLDF